MKYRNALEEEKEQVRKNLIRHSRFQNAKRYGILAMILAAVLILCLGWAWISGRNQVQEQSRAKLEEKNEQIADLKKQIQELMENPIVVNPAAPKINMASIQDEVKEIGELATVEYLFTDAGTYTDSTQLKDLLPVVESNKITEWSIPGTEKSFTLKWDGIIKAGVKVEQIQISVDEEASHITVSIPQAEILSFEVDKDSVEVLDERNNVFNPITVDDKVKFDQKTEEAMKCRAIENGILDKAQRNAQEIMKRLLISNAAIGELYTIEFVLAES